MRRIVLQKERRAADSRNLWASLGENGDLIIEGQDLGPEVERFWGAGMSEYEWAITVRSAKVPRLVSALGGEEGDDVLTLLADRYRENPRSATQTFLDEQGIPNEVWSRVGD